MLSELRAEAELERKGARARMEKETDELREQVQSRLDSILQSDQR